MIDTSSLMLSNQLGHNLLSPAREKITDGLVLINPTCPEMSSLLLRSEIYHYLCSTILCRDLYMYHPKMTFAMHAHALVKTVEEYHRNNKSSAYLDLGLKILYSIRKYWGSLCLSGDNVTLFKRWYQDWETITQSEKDNCNHPVQLLLMLGAYDLKQLVFERTNVSQLGLDNVDAWRYFFD